MRPFSELFNYPELALAKSEKIYLSLIAGETTLECVGLSESLAKIKSRWNSGPILVNCGFSIRICYNERGPLSWPIAHVCGECIYRLVVTDCLPIVAFNYLKSSYYYLQ